MGEGPLSETARRGARTRPGEHGQFVGSSSLLGHTLPEGTRIGGLEIVGLVGEGGFGIVYLAYDESLQRDVAVKEYMPSSLAARASGSFDVTVRAERYRETFEAGLRSFVNEARLLAKFDHASLLKVYRFWEANGTAYMAMPFYEGMTLKATLAAMREPPGEARLREWLTPILDALEVMHEAHCFHRDIAPDNILLTRHGPVLLDFGAARRVIGDMTHALTVVLKPGYAPIEQYGDTPMQQGAWTDLYALGCVVYYAVSGRTPPSSVERMMSGDSLEPLQRIGAGRYSDGFLRAIDAALALHPKDRPQTVARFRALLDACRPGVARAVALADEATLPPMAAAPRAARAPAAVPATVPATTPVTVRDDERTVIRRDTWTASAVAPTVAPTFAPDVPARRGSGVPRLVWVWAVGSAIALSVAGVLVVGPTTHSPAPAPAAVVVAPAPAPAAVVATPARAPVTAAITVPPSAAASEPALLPASTTTSGTRDAVVAPEPSPAIVAAPAARRPARVAAAPPPAPRGAPARCTDILQKASLEPLSAEEAAFLRRECR